MAPGGAGRIDLKIPYWYYVDNTGDYMYNPTATNKCSSDCMDIYSSFLSISDGSIQMLYANMPDSCIKGKEIIIKCRQFYNPVEPRKWDGFQFTTYDNEAVIAVIEQTVGG